jgi:hypothetical protein
MNQKLSIIRPALIFDSSVIGCDCIVLYARSAGNMKYTDNLAFSYIDNRIKEGKDNLSEKTCL